MFERTYCFNLKFKYLEVSIKIPKIFKNISITLINSFILEFIAELIKKYRNSIFAKTVFYTRQIGREGGFEISDVPDEGRVGFFKLGRPKIAEKIEIPNFLRAH